MTTSAASRTPFGSGPFGRDKPASSTGAGFRTSQTQMQQQQPGMPSGLAHATLLSQVVATPDKLTRLQPGTLPFQQAAGGAGSTRTVASASGGAGTSATGHNQLVAGPGGTMIQVQIPEHVLIYHSTKPELCERILRSPASVRDRFELLPWDSYSTLLKNKATKPLPAWCPDVDNQTQLKLPMLYFPKTRDMKRTIAVYKYITELPGLAEDLTENNSSSRAATSSAAAATSVVSTSAAASSVPRVGAVSRDWTDAYPKTPALGVSSVTTAVASKNRETSYSVVADSAAGSSLVAQQQQQRTIGILEQRLSSMEIQLDQSTRDNSKLRQLLGALAARVSALESGSRGDFKTGSSSGSGAASGGDRPDGDNHRRFATMTRQQHRSRQPQAYPQDEEGKEIKQGGFDDPPSEDEDTVSRGVTAVGGMDGTDVRSRGGAPGSDSSHVLQQQQQQQQTTGRPTHQVQQKRQSERGLEYKQEVSSAAAGMSLGGMDGDEEEHSSDGEW